MQPIAETADPFALFAEWFAQAASSEPADPNAMALATATSGGMPSVRMVLLKGWDGQGFVFYTHASSRKGQEMAENPRAALLFHWKSLTRQIRIEGTLSNVSAAEADDYYASRPRISRLGAWASHQSQPLDARATLERRVDEAEARFPGEDIPRPDGWLGYRLTPARFEFWQQMPYRLHDRLVYERAGAGWTTGRLYP